MEQSSFRILGPLEVSRGDRDVVLRGRRQRALLAILLLHANEVVPSQRLLAALWGDQAPESGVGALHVRVSQLRRSLGADGSSGSPIVTSAPGYLLRVEPGRIDSRLFERLAAEGSALLADGEPARAGDSFREALALWRGPALADFAYEEFAQAEIARLEELRLTCLEQRLETDLTLGRHAEIAGELEGLTAAHPLRERLRGQLMLALYRSGRQADALAVYRDTRDTLVDELGIEPGDSLRRLEQAILRQDPSLTLPARQHARTPSVRTPVTEERKLVTVLFADLVASTELVAANDPERARALLDRYADVLAAEVGTAGGTMEKFVGDAVLAVFGAPRAQEDHAERALTAALAIRRRLAEAFGGELAVRVGIATGEVVVGQARAGGSFATGMAVNAAARLAEAAAPGEILVSVRTARATSAFEFSQAAIVAAEGIPGGLECRVLVRQLSLTQPRRIDGRAAELVGREAELDALRAAYRRAVKTGRPALVTVVGDAGVGKSRLARELWDWLAAQSPEPLRRTSRCFPVGKRITYGPLRDVLQEELGLLSTDPPDLARHRLGRHEILGLALGLEVASELHPLAARERLREAWVEFLEGLTADRPVVLLVEDLHWAQELLVELLETALRELGGPLLVVATSRPELAGQWPSWGRSLPDSTTVWLDPLSPPETEVLLEQLLGADVPAHVRDLLVARAEGNPFFAEELLASLVDEGVLARGDAGWEVHGAEAGVFVPDSVQSAVAARVDLLPPPEKAALQAASVIGRVFWGGAVEELLPGTVPDFALLEARDFVRRRPMSSRAGERELAFKHALTREVAYASLPRAARARLHARFAEWLERTGGGRDEDAPFLAHHYAEAARPEDADLAWREEPDAASRVRAKALAWLRRSAELAIGRYEIDAGLALLQRALELEGSRPGRSALWRTIGQANALKHDGAAFWAAMECAIATAPDEASRAELFSELAFETCGRWGMWKSRADGERLDAWIERALELAEPDSPARARALAAKACRNPDEAEAAREALRIAATLDDPRRRVEALEARRLVAYTAGEFAEALDWSRRALELVPHLDADAGAATYNVAVFTFVGNGRFDEARRLAQAHDELTAPLTPHHRLHGVALQVELAECAGDWEGVRALEARTLDAIAANAGTPCVRNARSLLVAAAASAYLGSGDHARELAERADALGMKHFGHALGSARLRLAIALGDEAAAEELLATHPAPRRTLLDGRTMALQLASARLDGLVLVGAHACIEEEAPPFVRKGTYLEPFALRALGAAREDEALVERAHARFEALGLDWHAAQTDRLLA